MKKIIKTKNKKALSEIVAYVMLVVMSLSLASGVYIWLKTNVPADKETCSEDIALSFRNYTCDTLNRKITITIENKGFFSVNGFFIRGSNQTDNLPIIPLSQEKPDTIKGRYDFETAGVLTPLKPGTYETMVFKYDDAIPLRKIQIQPFKEGEKTKTLLLCDKGIVNQEITGCFATS